MNCTQTLTAADGRLVLRHRCSSAQPYYPNGYSHPLPRFPYDGATGLLAINFECDPAFAGSADCRAKTFYLTATPRRCWRTILNGAWGTPVSAFRNPLFPLAGTQLTTPAAVTEDTSNIREGEMGQLEQGDETN